MELHINDTFNKALPADADTSNTRRQVMKAAFSYVTPRVPGNPGLIHLSEEVAEILGIAESDIGSPEFVEIFSGSKIYEGTQPYAMCYGGHQFGSWAGQLGDGRAINLFEIEHSKKQWAVQLKGAGETPYSRTADGLAVLRSSIREHLCSEAMHYLGVPTTRSLSLVLTGDQVLRDMLYDGNPGYEKGAIVCRVSPSFIRFGNFEIFASRKDVENLKLLTEYTIRRFYPHIKNTDKDGYLHFFSEVCNRTLEMIIHWQRVGFVHGVMNTDNMSILGLTIDYGPYGWLEGYDHNWTPNTTDRQTRRYRYGQQPNVALWNLYQLANALYPLIEDADALEEILHAFKNNYEVQYTAMMRNKLGLTIDQSADTQLIEELKVLLHKTETDMTIFFRNLADFKKDVPLKEGIEILNFIKDAFYAPEQLAGEVLIAWQNWVEQYQLRLQSETRTDEERRIAMNTVNPKYVLRNYMAQLAIDAADNGDYSVLESLYTLLKHPYDEQPTQQQWFAKRPDWARHKVGCSMLSCSS
ncbi:MAG: YdiU family protein [Agriterribacter sp.]